MKTSTLTMDALNVRPKALYRPEFVFPAFSTSNRAKKGMKLVDLKNLGFIPAIAGGAPVNDDRNRGYNAAADLVTQTTDGVDLNELWDEYQQTVAMANAERQLMIDFLTFPVTDAVERVAQVSGADFEKASEYGEPVGIRPGTAYFTLGYTLDWYDLAARYTWKFLADAPRSQVDANNSMALEADNRNIFNEVMRTLFSNQNRLADINGIQDVNVYALYNADGTVPPKYKSYTFDGTHTHYVTSGAATIDSGDLDLVIDDLVSHGYSKQNGMTIVMLVNRREAQVIRTFRVASGDSNDFIPAQGTPGMYLPQNVELFGQGQVSANYRGLNVIGSYGDLMVIEEDTIPAGYTATIATGGRANLNNPVGLREHSNPSLRGLRLVKGPNPDYPLIDSFYNRGFGTGIRQRGGAFIMQITASASYTPPSAF
jgi:hypothetical protein